MYWYAYKAFIYGIMIILIGSYLLSNYFEALGYYYIFHFQIELGDQFVKQANKLYKI